MLALLYPTQTSFASIAILQESSSGLVSHVNSVLRSIEQFQRNTEQIRELYETITSEPDKSEKGTSSEGEASILEDATIRAGEGIEFELK